MILERTPPYSEEAEIGTLGAILLDGRRVYDLARRANLTDADFYAPAHRAVWGAVGAVLAANGYVDILTVTAHLRDAGQLDAVGGAAAMHALVDATPTAAHAEHYIGIVKRKGELRRLIERARETEARAYDPDADPQRLAARAEVEFAEQARATANPEADRLTLDAILGYEVDSSRHIAGNGWLRQGAGTLLIGGTGIGKSVLATQIGCCVAGGIPIFGMPVRDPRRVLIVQAENDIETMARDFGGILGHLTGADNAGCRAVVGAHLSVQRCVGRSGDTFFSWLRNEVLATGCELLVIDPLQSFLGAVNVNDSHSWLAFQQPLDELLTTLDIGLLLTCHTPKPPRADTPDNRTARQSVYDAVGTSALSNWARASATLSECPDGRFRLRLGKNAERAALYDANGRMLRDLYLQHSPNVKTPYWDYADQQGDAVSEARARVLREIARTPGASQRDIAAAAKCSVGLVNKIRREATESEDGLGAEVYDR